MDLGSKELKSGKDNVFNPHKDEIKEHIAQDQYEADREAAGHGGLINTNANDYSNAVDFNDPNNQ